MVHTWTSEHKDFEAKVIIVHFSMYGYLTLLHQAIPTPPQNQCIRGTRKSREEITRKEWEKWSMALLNCLSSRQQEAWVRLPQSYTNDWLHSCQRRGHSCTPGSDASWCSHCSSLPSAASRDHILQWIARPDRTFEINASIPLAASEGRVPGC